MTEYSRSGITRRTAAIVVGVIVVLAVGGIALLLVQGPSLCVPSSSTGSTAVAVQGLNESAGVGAERAANYLAANYNKEVGLIPETPSSCVFWLYSDNHLAAMALLDYGHHRNATLTSLAAGILTSNGRYSAAIGSAGNQYMLLEGPPCKVNASRDYTVSSSRGVVIKATLNNGTGLLDDTQYADVAFLEAVCLYQQGNSIGAIAAYDAGAKMFDGTGLRDLPFNQSCAVACQYQTYKLALFVYASTVLGQPVNAAAVSRLLSMQAPSGGLYTGYYADGSHGKTFTNTETTSLALLALSSLCNPASPGTC